MVGSASLFDSAAFNERLFFPRATATAPPPDATDLRIAVPGADLHLRWHRTLGDAPTVLLFHGNGETVADYDPAASSFAACGANLAVVDYRGYGTSTGTPTLRDALRDAHAVVGALTEASATRVVVMGRSLGSASAAELYAVPAAPDDGILGFIWESGFVDLGALVRRRGLELPASLTDDERATFDSAAKLRRGDRPMLVIHGENDTLIVPTEARAAFEAAGTRSKELVLVPQRGHNDVSLHSHYWDAIKRFVGALLLVTAVIAVTCGCEGMTIAPAGARGASDEASRARGPGRIDEELSVRTLAIDTYLVVHEPFVAANVLVAKMPDGTVVICSSPFETEASRALVGWVKATLKPSRIVAINTHFHFDGSGGNEAYRELGVETYASNLTQQLLKEKGVAGRADTARQLDGVERERMLAMKIVAAEHTFDEREGLAFTFGGEQVRVLYPGPGHSRDNVVVFFPSRQVLFGGCMIKGSASVGFIGDADLEHWETAVDDVRNLGARVVVPGHGPVGGPELFDLTASVVRKARAGKEQP